MDGGLQDIQQDNCYNGITEHGMDKGSNNGDHHDHFHLNVVVRESFTDDF